MADRTERLLIALQWMLFPVLDAANQICMKFLGLATQDVAFGGAWLMRVVSSPYAWGALLADIGGFLTWMLVLKRSNLSAVAPFNSLEYVLILIASFVLFHEPITLGHLLGIGCILAGLVLIGVKDEPSN